MIYAVKFFTNLYNIDQLICIDKYLIVQACSRVNLIFKDNKKYEKNKSNINFLNQTNIIRDKTKYKIVNDKNYKKLQRESKKIKHSNSMSKFDVLNQIDGIPQFKQSQSEKTIRKNFAILNEIEKLSK